MAQRAQYPRPNISDPRYFFSLARGDAIRTYAIRPAVLWVLAALAPLFAVWAGAATLYVAFHDEMLGAIAAHQTEMQFSYEDRLAEARAQLDRVAGRQLLDQNSFEGKMHDLLSRQAQLEQRSSLVSALADQARLKDKDMATLGERRPPAVNAKGALEAIFPLTKTDGAGDSIGQAKAYAPMAGVDNAPTGVIKPRPIEEPRQHTSEIQSNESERHAFADLTAAVDNPDIAAGDRLGLIGASLDRIERRQIAALNVMDGAATRNAARLNAIFAQTGLGAERLHLPAGGVGGPFIAAGGDNASAFDKVVARTAHNVEIFQRIKKALPFLPLRRPLIGQASVTSPFGYRADPFLGRPALHPGIDLVQAYGADIYATAVGKVVHAGPMGGYGNMVEIDHGNGVATRFGHMSEVLVNEGEEVKAGALLGKLGSTGRSTGPHLHYEVRVDGEPIDPSRFLIAGAELLPTE